MSQMPPPGPPGANAMGMRPHRGTMILVFGILGIACCVIFGIVAWVMGNGDLEAMASGQMDPSGDGLTRAGKICGMISVGLVILAIIAQVIILALGGGIMYMQP